MLALCHSKKSLRFYLASVLLAFAGWLWLLWSVYRAEGGNITLCFFRNITGKPCPACGSTAALMQILQADYIGALYTNPLGYIAGIGLILLPLWITKDLITRRPTLQNAVAAFDAAVKERPWLLLLILIPLILNWIWNFMKM